MKRGHLPNNLLPNLGQECTEDLVVFFNFMYIIVDCAVLVLNRLETNKELIISLDFSYPIIEKFLELIYLGEARASTSDKKDLVELIENLHIDLNDIRTEIKEEEEDVLNVEIEKKLETNENLDDNNRNCDQSELKEAKLTRSIHKPKQEIHEIKHENKKNQTENILNKRQFPCDECSYA